VASLPCWRCAPGGTKLVVASPRVPGHGCPEGRHVRPGLVAAGVTVFGREGVRKAADSEHPYGQASSRLPASFETLLLLGELASGSSGRRCSRLTAGEVPRRGQRLGFRRGGCFPSAVDIGVPGRPPEGRAASTRARPLKPDALHSRRTSGRSWLVLFGLGTGLDGRAV